MVITHGSPFDGWALPSYTPRDDLVWIHGGDRALIELAAAAALCGVPVELRGAFSEPDVAEMERLTDVRLQRPQEPRMPVPTDTVIIPEGTPDPLLFARVALSPARAVLVLMAAPGLFGWPFDRERVPADPTAVEPTSVGRPEQLVAARQFGLELWTNLSAIAEQARGAEIPHHYIGVGRPVPYPAPPRKRVDVVTLAANRWSGLAREAVRSLRPEITHEVIGRTTRARLLDSLGSARIFVHPVRIEGRSRLCEEARAMGTVPVLLASNHIGEGMDEASGAVTVGTIEDMAPAVHALLEDPARLGALVAAGRRHVREEVAWEPFVARVGAALAEPDLEVTRFSAGRAGFGARLAERETLASRDAALAAAEAQARTFAAREDELLAMVRAHAERAEVTGGELVEAQARLEALRSRKAVRAALRAAGAIALLRRGPRT